MSVRFAVLNECPRALSHRQSRQTGACASACTRCTVCLTPSLFCLQAKREQRLLPERWSKPRPESGLDCLICAELAFTTLLFPLRRFRTGSRGGRELARALALGAQRPVHHPAIQSPNVKAQRHWKAPTPSYKGPDAIEGPKGPTAEGSV